MSSFKESVLIPLSVFRRCSFTDFGEQKLRDPFIQFGQEPVERVKLYEQQRLHRRSQREQLQENLHQGGNIDKRAILQRITPNKRGEAEAILDFIIQNKGTITWDTRTMEVSIDGRPIPNSDIASILQRLTNSRMMRVNEIPPPGTRKVYEALVVKLGMPADWISTTLQLRASDRQRAKTGSWISVG